MTGRMGGSRWIRGPEAATALIWNREVKAVAPSLTEYPEHTIQIPAATHATPAARAIHRPHGASFSTSTSSARSAIHSTFITPTTNSSAIRTQQQPTQLAP